MRLALLLLALVACQPEPKDFPRLPGGGGGAGGGGGGGGSGSGGDDVDAPGFSGRVCLVSDLRQLDQCATTGADNLTVTLGVDTATTNVDGSFTMNQPTGSSLVWRVSGAGLVPSLMGLGFSNVIPAITIDDYQILLDANGFILTPGQGSIVINVVASNVPLVDAVVASVPAPQFTTRYDGSSAALWDTDGTGAFGVAWITGAPGGTTSTVTVTPPSPGTPQSNALLVESASITFATFGL